MRLALVPGTGNGRLARAVAEEIDVELEPCRIERFPDDEIGVSVPSVRGADVYIVQGTPPPLHENLMELLLLADAVRRSGAARVTGVAPYLGYARQDRREDEGDAIGGRVVATQLSSALDRLVAVDLHTTALEGFFACPVEHLTAVDLLARCVRPLVTDHVAVAPDLGAAKRADRFARLLGLDTAYVRKRRLSGRDVEVIGIDGEVRGRGALIVDDMISTGGTIAAAAAALRDAGARDLLVVATHGLFAGPAEERLAGLGSELLAVTDSVPPRATRLSLTTIGLAPLLGEAIERLHRDAPLGALVG